VKDWPTLVDERVLHQIQRVSYVCRWAKTALSTHTLSQIGLDSQNDGQDLFPFHPIMPRPFSACACLMRQVMRAGSQLLGRVCGIKSRTFRARLLVSGFHGYTFRKTLTRCSSPSYIPTSSVTLTRWRSRMPINFPVTTPCPLVIPCPIVFLDTMQSFKPRAPMRERYFPSFSLVLTEAGFLPRQPACSSPHTPKFHSHGSPRDNDPLMVTF